MYQRCLEEAEEFSDNHEQSSSGSSFSSSSSSSCSSSCLISFFSARACDLHLNMIQTTMMTTTNRY